MAKPLAMTFTTRVAQPDTAPGQFVVTTATGEIRIKGHLSTGTRGWLLRGEAACRRSVITLHVTAIENQQPRVPDLEHHEYEVRIAVKSPGKYGLRISHVFLLRPEGGFGLPHPVHEQNLSVP